MSVDFPRRGASAALASALRSVIDLIPVATLLADTVGQVAAVNDAWCELTGLNEQESVGQGWMAMLDIADRDQIGRAHV